MWEREPTAAAFEGGGRGRGMQPCGHLDLSQGETRVGLLTSRAARWMINASFSATRLVVICDNHKKKAIK